MFTPVFKLQGSNKGAIEGGAVTEEQKGEGLLGSNSGANYKSFQHLEKIKIEI